MPSDLAPGVGRDAALPTGDEDPGPAVADALHLWACRVAATASYEALSVTVFMTRPRGTFCSHRLMADRKAVMGGHWNRSNRLTRLELFRA